MSFDDNKVLKLSIGFAKICSSVQDHRQKFSVFNSSIGSGEQMRAMKSTTRKLELQGSIRRKEVITTRGSEDHQKLTSSEALSSEAVDVIRGSEDHQKLKDWKLLHFVKCCYCHAYKRREFERHLLGICIGCIVAKTNIQLVCCWILCSNMV